MRFTRYPRTIRRDPTPSKARVSAARKALQKERDKAPLFAEEIAAEQPSPEERIARIDDGAARWWDDRRKDVAASWRKSRAILHSLPDETRFAILAEWQYGYLPGSHEYLADLIYARLIQHGRALRPILSGAPRVSGARYLRSLRDHADRT